MITCYHKECDNLEVMLTDENVEFLGKVADSIVGTVDRLSEKVTINGKYILLMILKFRFHQFHSLIFFIMCYFNFVTRQNILHMYLCTSMFYS